MSARRGFTLIELMVVLAIVSLLVALAAPRYFQSVEMAKEASLKTSLKVMRDAIDQFAADKGRYPDALLELEAARYLRGVPEDPVTGSRDTWELVAPPAHSVLAGRVADVRSGAKGRSRQGDMYAAW